MNHPTSVQVLPPLPNTGHGSPRAWRISVYPPGAGDEEVRYAWTESELIDIKARLKGIYGAGVIIKVRAVYLIHPRFYDHLVRSTYYDSIGDNAVRESKNNGKT